MRDQYKSKKQLVQELAVLRQQLSEYEGRKTAFPGAKPGQVQHPNTDSELAHRLAVEELVVSISTRFVNLPTEKVDAEIEAALQRIGEFVGAGRCFLDLFSENRMRLSQTYEWCAGGVSPRPDEVRQVSLAPLSWTMTRLERGEEVYVPSIADLPPEANAEKALWQGMGARSLLTLPLLQGDSLIGHLGFSSYHAGCLCVKEDVRLLRVLGEIILSALDRRQVEQERAIERGVWRALLDSLPDVVYVKDTQSRFLEANSAVAHLMGATNSDWLIGKTDFDYFSEDLAAQYREKELTVMNTGRPLLDQIELVVDPTNGEEKWYSTSIVPLQNGDGVVSCVVGIGRDITQRRQAEYALRQSEKRYRAIVEDQTELVCRSTPDGKITFANEAYCRTIGKRSEELIGSCWNDYVFQDDRAVVQAYFEALPEILKPDRPITTHEHRIITATGEVRWMQWINHGIFDDEGKLIELQDVGRDVTDRVQAQEALRKANEDLELRVQERTADLTALNQQLEREITERKRVADALRLAEKEKQTILDSMVGHVSLFDTKMRILWMNRAASEYQNRSADELIGRLCYEVVAHRDDLCPNCGVARAMATGQPQDVEKKTPDGKTWFIRSFPVKDEDGNVTAGIELSLDVTDRVVAEEALVRQEREKQVVLDGVLSHVGYYDLDMRIKWLNQAMCDYIGISRDDAIGRFCYEVIWNRHAPCPECPVIKSMNTGQTCEYDRVTPDGRVWYLRGYPIHDADGQLVGGVELSLETTDRVRAEQALRRSEEHLSKIFRSSPQPLIITRLSDGLILDANDACAETLGSNLENICGCTTFEVGLIDQETHQRILTILRERGTYRRVEAPFYTRSGEERIGLFSGELIEVDGEQRLVQGINDITGLKRAESALRYRLAVEELVAGISARFLNSRADQTYEAIVWALRLVGEYTGVSRSYFSLVSDEGKRVKRRFEWCAEGVEPIADRVDGLSMAPFQWTLNKFTRREVIQVPRVADLPEEANAEKDRWQSLDIASLLSIPLYRNDSLVGVLGFDSKQTGKTWSDEDVSLLRLVGERIISVLARRQIEDDLQASEARYRGVVEDQTELICRWKTDGTLVFVNDNYARYFGKSSQELVGQSFTQLVPEDGKTRLKERIVREVESLTPDNPTRTFEHEVVSGSGEVRWQQWVDRAIFDESEQVVEFQSVGRDITDLKLAEQALQHRLDLENLVSSISGRFISVGSDNIDLEISQALESVGNFLNVDHVHFNLLSRNGTRIEYRYGWPADAASSRTRELMEYPIGCFGWSMDQLKQGQPVSITRIADLPPEAEAEKKVWSAHRVTSVLALPLRQGDNLIGTLVFDTLAEKREWSQEDVNILGLLVEIFANVLVRRQAEQEIVRAERLAALGRLAASLAHEINNPLQIMQSHVDLILDFPLGDNEKRDYMQIIRHEIGRLNDITRGVLNFARPHPTADRSADVLQAVRNVLLLSRKQLEQHNIVVTTDLQDVSHVPISSKELEQIFVNLMLNAIEAMSENGGGHLHIVVSQNRNQVKVVFSNDGPAIPVDKLPHIFEPFYTTKQQGSGLGLWVSYNLLRGIGSLNVQNLSSDRGVVFVVILNVDSGLSGG